MGVISCGNVVWNPFHNSISSYGMAFNHAFRINKADISILVGCDVGLNSFFAIKVVVGLISSNCCMVSVESEVYVDVSGSNSSC